VIIKPIAFTTLHTVRFDSVISLLSGNHAWAVQYQFCFHGAEFEKIVLESSINTVI